MFKWLAKLFEGTTIPEVINDSVAPAPIAAPVKKTTTKKKTSSKKGTSKCDFDKLTKPQLLAEAKHRGIKANASMKKADILAAINNG